jgi:hypothetical protein
VSHSSFPFPQTGYPRGGTGLQKLPASRSRSYRSHTYDGELQHNDAHAALYAPLDSAEVRVMAARNARIAADDEFADFLCELQEEVVGEAERLLQTRVAE